MSSDIFSPAGDNSTAVCTNKVFCGVKQSSHTICMCLHLILWHKSLTLRICCDRNIPLQESYQPADAAGNNVQLSQHVEVCRWSLMISSTASMPIYNGVTCAFMILIHCVKAIQLFECGIWPCSMWEGTIWIECRVRLKSARLDSVIKPDLY